MGITIEEISYDPVSLEQAKILKSLGYSGLCLKYYMELDGVPHCTKGLKCAKERMNHNAYDSFIYSAPPITDSVVRHMLNLG